MKVKARDNFPTKRKKGYVVAKPSTSLLKRRLDIAEIVRKNGEIKVDDLAEMLSVSGVTIRNDLNYTEQQGYLKRSFGGAIYTAQPVRAAVSHDVVQSQALEHSVELELAKQVARLVCDDDTVFWGPERCCVKRFLSGRLSGSVPYHQRS